MGNVQIAHCLPEGVFAMAGKAASRMRDGTAMVADAGPPLQGLTACVRAGAMAACLALAI
jgi:hypothetical protein